MAYKDESKYKTSPEKREYDRQWRLDNPGWHIKYRQDNKQNILYIGLIDEEYYFGHTSKGIDARRDDHIYNSRHDKRNGNPRMRELYKQLGEDEFIKRITFKVIKTFDTLADAKAAEKLMLSIYVGSKECMNKHK